MPYYESVFIARPDISAAQVEALTESMSAIVTEGGGNVAQTEYWGLKSLAYRIKKNRKGHYTMLALDAPAPAVKEFERNMRLNEDVLRLMTIRVDELDAEPSIMMRNKNSRDERSRRDDRSENKTDEAPESKAKAEIETESAEAKADAPAASENEGEDK
ncbi:MAG: 30S ribosomal protein S6 [Alphaproteobacteria bacterium]|nr:30S ribosomal protein S6 [Alphaproteobacteria bacterium]